MTSDREDRRRHPRLPIGCRIELRDRYGTWACETADIGPRGCQIMTSRAPSVGGLLEMAIESVHAPDPLEVVGQVAWVLQGPSVRAGISFLGRVEGKSVGPVDWFFGVLGQELAAAACGEAGRPVADLMVYLGMPPALVRAPEEGEIISRVGEGARLADLATSYSTAVSLTLLRRGWLTLVRGSAVAPEEWQPAFSGAGGSGPCVQTVGMSGGFANPPTLHRIGARSGSVASRPAATI